MKNLKQKISDVLVAELETKTLDKITVSTITEAIGVSRQAFYYHFYDIYEVIEWIFKDAAAKLVSEKVDVDNWALGFYNVMSWLKENKNFVINSFKSVNREYIETFLYNVMSPYVTNVVNQETKGHNITKEQRSFIVQFYTIAFGAVIINWIKHEMKEEPKEIIDNLRTLNDNGIYNAVKNFERNN